MSDKTISERILERIQSSNTRYWAGDNISEYILDSERAELVDELTVKFEDEAGLAVMTYDDYGNAAEAALVYREMGAIVTLNQL